MRVLLDSGLRFPQGLAVDDYRQMLYVADPSLGKLVGYKLSAVDGSLKVGKMETIADGVEVRAVAVDGIGNVWFTDEPNQRIMRVPARAIEERDTTPEIVYDGVDFQEVRSPGGIAVDNFYVYWLNKADGKKVGSLIRAPQRPPVTFIEGNISNFTTDALEAQRFIHRLASNADKCYGVCLALQHAFYTDDTKVVYGVSRAAVARDEEVPIASYLSEPRGCAYDGSGTIYFADKQANAIFSLPGNMKQLTHQRDMVKAAELEGAFGVTVFTDLHGPWED